MIHPSDRLVLPTAIRCPVCDNMIMTYRVVRPRGRKSSETLCGGGLGLAETNQREVTQGRHRAALDQFYSLGSRRPLRVARPGELGAPAKLTHHRLQPLLDEAPHPGIRTDPAQQDHLAARPQHPGELV